MGGRHAVMKRNPKQMCWPFLIMCLNCHQIITRQKAGGLKSELSGQVTVFFTIKTQAIMRPTQADYSMIFGNWNKVNSYISALKPLPRLPNSPKRP